MKQVLILLLYLTGVALLVTAAPYKYYLIQQTKTWNNAKTYCRANHIDMATIRNDADMLKLQTQVQEIQFTGDAWFGVYRESYGWRWSYKNETPVMFIWGSGEPSNDGNREECGVIHPAGNWWDVPCAWTVPCWCYDERNSGNSRYIYIPTLMNWFQAQRYCRLHHTDLASSRDSTENSILKATPVTFTWTGLHRINWKWLDQTNLNNINWKPGQPDNLASLEDCGYLSNLQAADDQCSKLKPFFCYRIITGQIQILRFKVQSDQNMNDPAVKAALLEKILQKLNEHGVEQNITLKWREQAGGDVFQKIVVDDTVKRKTCNVDSL